MSTSLHEALKGWHLYVWPEFNLIHRQIFKKNSCGSTEFVCDSFVFIPFECQVRRDSHRYLQEAEMREEGGTPAIVGAVRAGLAFQLKEAVTADVIMARERQLYQ